VRIHGLRFYTHADAATASASAPKLVKLFSNNTNLSFSDVDSEIPTQVFTLSEKALKGEEQLTKFSKFTNVRSLTLFVESNQGDTPVTVLNRLEIIGQAVDGMDVNQLKKIGNEQGE